jgi:hypothetical protein
LNQRGARFATLIFHVAGQGRPVLIIGNAIGTVPLRLRLALFVESRRRDRLLALRLDDRRRVRRIHGFVAADIDLRVLVAGVLAKSLLEFRLGILLLDDRWRPPCLVLGVVHFALLPKSVRG